MAPNDVVLPPDADLCAFMQSIELAVVDAYDRLAPLFSDDDKPMVASFQAHHKDYAAALAQFATTPAPRPSQTLAFILAGRLQTVSDQRGAFNFAFELENQIASTYMFMLTTLMSPDVIRLVSTIVPVISEHAVVFGSLAGFLTSGLFPNGPFESSAVGDGTDVKLGFDPIAFPVG